VGKITKYLNRSAAIPTAGYSVMVCRLAVVFVYMRDGLLRCRSRM